VAEGRDHGWPDQHASSSAVALALLSALGRIHQTRGLISALLFQPGYGFSPSGAWPAGPETTFRHLSIRCRALVVTIPRYPPARAKILLISPTVDVSNHWLFGINIAHHEDEQCVSSDRYPPKRLINESDALARFNVPRLCRSKKTFPNRGEPN
jgi:hypothetical protein